MIETALKYVVLTGGIVGFLAMLGWPVSRLLRLGDDSAIPVPVLGMCVLPLLSWYWLRITGFGLRPLIVGLAGVLVIIDVVVLLKARSGLHFGPALATAVCAGLAVTALCAVNYESVLHLDYVTTAASANNDAVAWVRDGQHVNDEGLEKSGNIVGHDFGESAKTDGFGGVVLLSAATTVTGKETYQVGLAAMFAAIAMVLLATARLVEHLSRLGRLQSIFVAAACISPMLFFYVAGNYFLAQMMAMAALPCILLTLIKMSNADSRQRMVRLALSLGILLFFLLSAYAHMTFLSLPLLAPIAILPGAKGGLVSRLRRVIVGAVLGLASALLIAPDLTAISIRRAIAIGRSQDAGWRLPAFLPTELLGFGRGLVPKFTAPRVVASSLIVVCAAWSAWYLYRRGVRAAGYCAICIVAILSSYALLYWREGGGTYQQWKWITYLQPMFVASVLSLLVLQLRYWVGPWPLRLHRWTAKNEWFRADALASVAALVLILVGTLNGQQALGPLRGDQPNLTADSQLVDLQRSPSLKSVKELNVNVAAFWDSMWASYFLRDKKVFLVQPTYYGVHAPTAKWTLDRVDSGPLPSGQPTMDINATYRLVEQPEGPFSDTSTTLDAKLTVLSDQVVGGKRILRVRALNTGPTTWLPDISKVGGVQLGGFLVDDEGSVVVRELIRAPLTVTKPVAPGWWVDLTVEGQETYGQGHLALQMVSEGVAWFGGSLTVEPPDDGSTP